MTDETSDNATTETSAADNVADMVDSQEQSSAPEWLPGKFWDAEKGEANYENLAKSYGELEKRFGSFTGAPEDYEVQLSEEVTSKGVELDVEHPLIPEAKEFAKNLQMNQEGFNQMMDLLGTYEKARSDALQEEMAADIKSLGDNADRRINNLNQWASANLSGDMLEGFKDAAVSANAVQALEQIVSMTRSAPLQPNEGSAADTVSESEVREMQFAKDEHGNRRIQTDKAFKAEYEKKRDMLYGTEPHRQIIGKRG